MGLGAKVEEGALVCHKGFRFPEATMKNQNLFNSDKERNNRI